MEPPGMAKRISIINFKGGVGKTTLAFNLGAGLARFHDATVLLVDMDHQSSLSIVCLGRRGWEGCSDHTVDGVFEHFPAPNLPGSEIIHASSFGAGRRYASVQIVPAKLELDNTEIKLTASHSGNAIQSEWDKRTLMCRWIEEAGVDELYDYILFDCAPATKIVSQNAIAASHGYVVPVVPEAVMVRGVPHLYNLIRSGIDSELSAYAASPMSESRPIYVPDTELVGLVVTRIQRAGRAESGYTNDHTQHLRSLSDQWDERLLEPYVVNGIGVSEALTDSVPVYERANTQNIGGRGIHRQYQQLVERLKNRIDRL